MGVICKFLVTVRRYWGVCIGFSENAKCRENLANVGISLSWNGYDGEEEFMLLTYSEKYNVSVERFYPLEILE